MSKNVQFAIAGTLALIMIVGGVLFARKNSQEGATCPFCGNNYPHAEMMGHKLRCPENDTDLTPRPGKEAN